MYSFGLTRKQCGVIFSNWKKGNIKATDKMIKWMYDVIQDSRVFMNSDSAECNQTMHFALDHIFAGEYEEAQKSFENAFGRWNAAHDCQDYI